MSVNPEFWEGEAGEPQVQGQLGQLRESLSKNKIEKKVRNVAQPEGPVSISKLEWGTEQRGEISTFLQKTERI